MKIGILTFHFATNYGAVLQAYALQKYLCKMGHEVEIIDFVPEFCRKSLIQCFNTRRIRTFVLAIHELRKESNFREFRTNNLVLSARKYNTVAELTSNPPDLDAYICGSDQIWNKRLTLRLLSEVGSAMPYFLDFGKDDIKRIAYAVSFGDARLYSDYPSELSAHVLRSLSRFSAISVREQSGIAILDSLGVENMSLMPDPTLLLDVGDYDKLSCQKVESEFFFYILHHEQVEIEKTLKVWKKRSKTVVGVTMHSTMGIEDWLGYIRTAQNVVTNSYHGIIFSILFQRPFVAVPVTGSLAKMNDRIFTLLSRLGLADRIMKTCEASEIESILGRPINWHEVNSNVEVLKHDALLFVRNNIGSTS